VCPITHPFSPLLPPPPLRDLGALVFVLHVRDEARSVTIFYQVGYATKEGRSNVVVVVFLTQRGAGKGEKCVGSTEVCLQ